MVTRIRRTRRLGAVLMSTSLAMGVLLATLSPATAQEEPQAPEDTAPLELEEIAYWTYPVGSALPPTLTSEFPPGVICIVRPEACPESLNPVSETVEGGLEGAKDNEPDAPRDPVPPDSLPVAIQNGVKRHEAAAKFSLERPTGQLIDRFVVVLGETQPTYHSSSPAFRQAVLAALTCPRGCDQDQFNKVLEKQPAESAVLGVEACPFTAPFEPGPSQAPPEDGHPVDCLYGTNGVRVPGADGVWVFDLTFAAMAWSDGTLENHGVLFRPVGAPNLAYGDPDPTTTAQVTLESAGAAAAMETSPEPTGGFGDNGGGSGEPFTPAPSGGDSFGSGGGGFSSSPSGGISSDSFAPPATTSPDEMGSAPQVAEPAPAPGEEPAVAPVAGVTGDEPVGSAWWVWLLVPVFAAGAWLTAQSLTADLAFAEAGQRPGAMTRLIARRHGGGTTSTPATTV